MILITIENLGKTAEILQTRAITKVHILVTITIISQWVNSIKESPTRIINKVPTSTNIEVDLVSLTAV